MTADTKQILNDAVNRKEALRLASRLEAPHLTFSLSSRLVRDLRTVVRVPACIMDYRRHDHAMRRPITAKLIGHQLPRRSPLAPHQLAKEPLSGSAIATSLDQDIDHIAILIDGAPQILLPAADLHEDLIEMPRIAEARLASLGSGGIPGPNFRHQRRMDS